MAVWRRSRDLLPGPDWQLLYTIPVILTHVIPAGIGPPVSARGISAAAQITSDRLITGRKSIIAAPHKNLTGAFTFVCIQRNNLGFGG
jgi:hypothetical protein